jgi:ketosteroid isomerase-like protein
MRVIQAAFAVSMMTLLVYGCALVGGPTPTEEILTALTEYHTAEKAGDVEQMLVTISDDFSNSQGATKPMLRGFFGALAAQGVLQTVSVDMAKCEITVEGDSAILEPIVYTSSMGLASYSYKMRKEADGVWRLINSEQI